jgi:hypothetical protein
MTTLGRKQPLASGRFRPIAVVLACRAYGRHAANAPLRLAALDVLKLSFKFDMRRSDPITGRGALDGGLALTEAGT